ncbi:MAG: hypothetical protein V4616_09075 [Bacteroidota bacterium]
MTPEENQEQVRAELARQLEKPTQEAFKFLRQEYDPAADEESADAVLTMDEIEKLVARKDISIYAPTLGELLETAGYIRKMIIRKNTMQMGWLFKTKK